MNIAKMAGQGARELDEDTTNVNTISDQLARLPPLNQSTTQQTLEIRENVCPHLAANLSYNEVEDLSNQLDPCKNRTRKGIIALMQNLKAKGWLSHDEYTTVWQSCYGGERPALGMMHHLASSQCTTLNELKELAKKGECDQKILSCIVECIEEGQGGTRLDLLPQDMIDKLTSNLSYEPEPEIKGLQKKWKRVASEAKLESYIIKSLDIPAQQDMEWKSLTEQLFDFIRSKYPNFKVATLAKALHDIGRVDLLQSAKLKLFEKCRHPEGEKCLHEVAQTLVKDIQDGYDGNLN